MFKDLNENMHLDKFSTNFGIRHNALTLYITYFLGGGAL